MRFAIVLALAAVLCGSASAVGFGGLSQVTDTTELRGKIETSLVQFANEHNLSWSLLDIIHAEYQVIAGARYVVDANVKSGSETKRCNFEIIEQSWMDFIKVTVSCHPENKQYTVQRGQQSQ